MAEGSGQDGYALGELGRRLIHQAGDELSAGRNDDVTLKEGMTCNEARGQQYRGGDGRAI